MGPHVIQDKINGNKLDSTGLLRTINNCQDPRTLNAIQTTITLPSYKKNVHVLSRRLSRPPLKLRAVSYNNDSANGKQNNQITI